MGVRLYPNTRKPESLERLAGVAPGTHARLLAVQARHKDEREAAGAAWDGYYDDYRQWQEIHDDPDLGALEDFLTFGWGKFHGGVIAPGYAGQLMPSQAVYIRRLFQDNGITADVALCEGVHWC